MPSTNVEPTAGQPVAPRRIPWAPLIMAAVIVALVIGSVVAVAVLRTPS